MSDPAVYPVVVQVVLLARDGCLGLSRRVELPFAPFVGLQLAGLTAERSGSVRVAAVAWHAGERRFYADLGDWEAPEQGIAGLIDYFGPSWRLHEPGQVCEGVD